MAGSAVRAAAVVVVVVVTVVAGGSSLAAPVSCSRLLLVATARGAASLSGILAGSFSAAVLHVASLSGILDGSFSVTAQSVASLSGVLAGSFSTISVTARSGEDDLASMSSVAGAEDSAIDPETIWLAIIVDDNDAGMLFRGEPGTSGGVLQSTSSADIVFEASKLVLSIRVEHFKESSNLTRVTVSFLVWLDRGDASVSVPDADC